MTKAAWPLRLFALLSLCLLLAACDTPPDATETPTPFPITIIPPSATIAPIPPTLFNIEGGNVDGNKFTPGAPPVATGSATLALTAAPTEATIPMTFVMPDGLIIAGTYYLGSAKPSSTVLLLHMAGSNKEAWHDFAVQLQSKGFSAVAVDLRGHGETGGSVDWGKASGDVVTILARLQTLPGVDPARISVMGASMGANLAVNACAETQACKSIVLLSPTLEDQGIKTGDAMGRYGAHPVLIVSPRDSKPSGAVGSALDKLAKGDHTLIAYDSSVSGMALFTSHPDLGKTIIQWLTAH